MKKASVFILLSVLLLCLCACETVSEENPLDGFQITAVAGVQVQDDCVTLTKAQYDELVLSPEENCDYTLFSGVQAQISINGKQLVFDFDNAKRHYRKVCGYDIRVV